MGETSATGRYQRGNSQPSAATIALDVSRNKIRAATAVPNTGSHIDRIDT